MGSGPPMALLLQALVVFIVLVLLVYPFVLSATNRLLNRFWSPYWRTLATVILVGIAALIANFIVFRLAGTRNPWVLGVVGVVVTALAGGGIMNGLIRHKDGAPLGYSRAALTCLVFGIVVTLIGLALAPWQKGMQAKMKGHMPAAAVTATTAPATSTPVAAGSVVRVAPAPPVASSAPAKAASVPARATSTH